MLSVAPVLTDPHVSNIAAHIAKMDWNGQKVDAIENQWIVRFSNERAAKALSKNAALTSIFGQDASLRMDEALHGVGVLDAPGSTAEKVLAWAKNRRDVLYVEPNAVMRATGIPNDPIFANEGTVDGLWGMHNDGQAQLSWNGTNFVQSSQSGTAGVDIDAFGAWDTTTGSHTVAIGVIDTGIDYTHPDLYLNIWLNQGEIPTSLASQLVDVTGDGLITFVDLNNSANSSFVTDENANGYIDGGDLLADSSWENGTDEDGNSHDDDLIGWNFITNTNDPMDDHFHGTHVAGIIGATGNDSFGITGINWNVSLVPIKVLNNVGNGTEVQIVGGIAYSTALRRDDGVNLVATNNSYGSNFLSQLESDEISEAESQGILFVAAAGNFLQNNDVSPFYPAAFSNDNIISVAATNSDDGLASFSNIGGTSVDLGAPGVNILSTFPLSVNEYSTISGTSMAAPHVAGVVGLLAAANPQATSAGIKEAILISADPISSLNGRTVTGGRLNAASALSTIVVSTLTDEDDGNYNDGDLSLREALYLASTSSSDKPIIGFESSLVGGTITLEDGLTIDSSVEIRGPGANALAIDGQLGWTVFTITSSSLDVAIRGLTIKRGYGGFAGGIDSKGNLTLDGVAILDSWSNTLVGGLRQYGGELLVINSTIANNQGAGSGGVLLTNVTSAQFKNTTISGNRTTLSWAGGVTVTGTSSVEFINSTIANNKTKTAGGGIRVEGGSVTLHNTIVAGNYKNTTATPDDVYGSFVSTSSYNLIGVIDGSTGLNASTSYFGTAVSPRDAHLSALGDYGGPTATIAPETTSDAINHGSDAVAISAGLATDQRGFNRFADQVDIGAVELDAPIVVTTLADDSVGAPDYIHPSLRDALALVTNIPGKDTITFDPRLLIWGGTISLQEGLTIDSSVEILGPRADALAIDGQLGWTVFTITSSSLDVAIRGLTIKRGYGGFAGGIDSKGNLTLDGVAILDSWSNTLVGGLRQYGGELLVINSTIANNQGAGSGGVLLTNVTSAQFKNTTISGNRTTLSWAGGVTVTGTSSVEFINSTIANNKTKTAGGGIRVEGGSVTLHNTIVAGNYKNTTATPDDVYGSFVSTSSYNLIGVIDGSTGLNASTSLYGTSSAPRDARLRPLFYYGGTTLTHALFSDSHAIDAGDDSVALAHDLEFDQRGDDHYRIVEGDGQPGLHVDIGAFELALDEFQN